MVNIKHARNKNGVKPRYPSTPSLVIVNKTAKAMKKNSYGKLRGYKLYNSALSHFLQLEYYSEVLCCI